jgi:hypothetical protein
VHLDVILVIDQFDALFLNVFISCLYMFRATQCSSSGESIESVLFDVQFRTGTSNSHPSECVIPDDVLTQAGPPDDEHLLLETCRGMK